MKAKNNGNKLSWPETMCRIHNGGPDSWRDDADWFVRNRGYTLRQGQLKIERSETYYWKVMREVERLYANK